MSNLSDKTVQTDFLQLNLDFFIMAVNIGIKNSSSTIPAIANNWNSKDNNFANLHHHRLWLMIDGEAFVETKFGDITLEKGKAYFIPASSIISTNCPYSFLCRGMTNIFLNFDLKTDVIAFLGDFFINSTNLVFAEIFASVFSFI